MDTTVVFYTIRMRRKLRCGTTKAGQMTQIHKNLTGKGLPRLQVKNPLGQLRTSFHHARK